VATSPDSSKRALAADRLSHLDVVPPFAILVLARALGDRSKTTRDEAMLSLIRVARRGEDVSAPVMHMLSPRERPETHAAAARVLAQSRRPTPAAVPLLVPLLGCSPSPEARAAAADALAAIGGGERRVHEALVPALADPDPTVRAAAAEALGIDREPR
jgi:HEAT repeat protein